MLAQFRNQAIRAAMTPARTNAPIRHFSYHKNLTVYQQTVTRRVCEFTGRTFKPFQSKRDEFLAEQEKFDVASLNNHHVDVAMLPPGARVSRFVRDPRDLVVSGYHYHKRGAEPWCLIPNPTVEDWRNVNGTVPEGLGPGESFSDYLQRVDMETGLIAEIEFRQRHFESMRAWIGEPNVLVVTYEEMMQDEIAAFRRLAEHYGLSRPETFLWTRLAARYSKGGQSRRIARHVRDPRAGQWQGVFSDAVREYFDTRYADVVAALKY